MAATKITVLFLLVSSLLSLTNAEEKQTNSLAESDAAAVSTPLKTVFVLLSLAALSGSLLAIMSIFFYPSLAKNLELVIGSSARKSRLQKRSLDYLGPILQTLAKAYEVYESEANGDTKKNSPKELFYER